MISYLLSLFKKTLLFTNVLFAELIAIVDPTIFPKKMPLLTFVSFAKFNFITAFPVLLTNIASKLELIVPLTSITAPCALLLMK